MAEWVTATWGDVITLQRGVDITKSAQNLSGPVPVVSSGGPNSFHDVALQDGPGVVMGRKGTLGRVYFMPGPYWPHDTTLWVRDFKGNDPRFVYYALTNLDVSNFNVGTASPTINRNHVHPVPVQWPTSLAEQRAIAATLGALDDKIESNRRVVRLSLVLADALYSAACDDGGRVASIADVVEFHNRKRVPLSSQEREQRSGPYPYYGATGVFGHVDDFLFDQVLVLVGEDGSVVNDDGTPVTQYVWGKAWINNHAHVLTGSGISNELLLVGLRATDVRPVVTGAVQAKISMGSLKSVLLPLPAEGPAQQELERRLTALFANHRRLHDEIRHLESARDTLLPALLSGRLRVRSVAS